MAEDLADRRGLADVRPVVVRDPLELVAGGRGAFAAVVGQRDLEIGRCQPVQERIGDGDDTFPGAPHLGEVRGRGRRAVGDGIKDRLDREAVAADRPDQALVPGQVPDHPRDRVHRPKPLERIRRGNALQATLEFGAGETELVDAGMRHGTKDSDAPAAGSGVPSGTPGEPVARPTPWRSALPSPDDLPPHVRRMVDEIETEIGEEPGRASTVIEGEGRDHDANGRVEAAVRQIVEEIGEDPDRQGLAGTPERVHRMYTELTAGYHVDPDRLINGAIFDVAYSEMVVVRDIPFYSLCEHHLLPFFGTASVAYIPRGRVVGLSKIPRIVETYSRRLQVQERLTQQIAQFLQDRLDPQGVGVVMEATHLCAAMRGVRKPGTIMTTSAVLGLFRTRDRTRAEFFAHLARRPPEA